MREYVERVGVEHRGGLPPLLVRIRIRVRVRPRARARVREPARAARRALKRRGLPAEGGSLTVPPLLRRAEFGM